MTSTHETERGSPSLTATGNMGRRNRPRTRPWLHPMPRLVAGFLIGARFSTLTRRIVALNAAALFALALGVLYLNQSRAGLIDARIQSLMTQGEMIAGAIAEWATLEPEAAIIEPGAENSPEQNYGARLNCETPTNIDLETAKPVLERLVSPTQTRARLFDTRGCLVLDSSRLAAPDKVMTYVLPPPEAAEEGWFARLYDWVAGVLREEQLPRYREPPEATGAVYEEVLAALRGQADSAVRVNEQGELIVSIAIPLQPIRVVRGALLLSTEGGDIDAIVRAERIAILQFFLVALGVTVLLSVLLAGTIAIPIHRLAEAAERVRRSVTARVDIPDFTDRRDEVGELSGVLRDMTRALYQRIDAIEQFAADVAHELKNPLSSLRSAVETFPLARDKEAQARLFRIMQDDVGRLDRLISDISDASRIDAELSREEMQPVDMAALLQGVVEIFRMTARKDNVSIVLNISERPDMARPFLVEGFETRLGQVVRNLIDNALSFSPPGGTVYIGARRIGDTVIVVVEDEGPGIQEESLETIFRRFYTQRPDPEAFGKNSGLGLSISHQIVEAHGGRIWAENRRRPEGEIPQPGQNPVSGARFVVAIPAKTD